MIEIHIPKGVENNKQYIYEGWGEQAVKPNEKSGDFIIRLNVENHDIFERDNLDLKHKTQITLYESIIGKELIIPYFEEKIVINTNIFGIINPEKEYIVLEKGLRNEMNQKGNLKIIFKIIYPEKTFNNDEINDITNIFKKLNLI
jgi:DnaJ-class molecular chaperone